MLDIVLNRRGGVPVREQLVAQLELRIMDGRLAPGQRLPSVRALARMLKVHANTVSAAYQDLEATGHVQLRRGSGVFVRGRGPATIEEAGGLDEMIRLALAAAARKGFRAPEIRAAVERWLAAGPPDRVVVVDPAPDVGRLLVHELGPSLPVPVSCCTPEELERERALLSGALAVALPFHLERVRKLAPEAAVVRVNLELSREDRKALAGLAPGAIVLLVSSSPTVLQVAEVLFRSLRGDELHFEGRLLEQEREWKRLLPAADVVIADALAAEAVKRARPRRLREARLVTQAALARIRAALAAVVGPR